MKDEFSKISVDNTFVRKILLYKFSSKEIVIEIIFLQIMFDLGKNIVCFKILRR
jgi:hypothetical protein